MRTTLDFSPLFRSSIGFDRVFDLLDSASRIQTMDNWPPYDIVRTGEDSYRITMAVAGFRREDLSLTEEPNLLVVRGARSGDEDGNYLHRGIAGRAFERRFELADYMKISGASLDNGLLRIELMRELPEEMRPRRIEIGRADETPRLSGESQPRQLESHPQQKQAA